MSGASLTDAWGVYHGFYDIDGQYHEVSPETLTHLHQSIQKGDVSEVEGLIGGMLPVWVVTVGESVHFPKPGLLRLETGVTWPDGSTERQTPGDFADLPLGYHTYFLENQTHELISAVDHDYSEEARLSTCSKIHPKASAIQVIVVPSQCRTPERSWGVSLQLYACRSQESWGIGDYRDLRKVLEWAKSAGADLAMINPQGTAAPILPQNPSPYYSTSRRFRNPLAICVEEIPGYETLPPSQRQEIEAIATKTRLLNEQRIIDRDAIFPAKMRALEILFEHFVTQQANDSVNLAKFDAFCKELEKSLNELAAWNILARRYGAVWMSWPEIYRHPESPDIQALLQEQTRMVQFEKWIQWVADGQFARAAQTLPVVQDLPIGVCPDGVDAWAWQNCFAFDCEAGAPPDAFNPLGQRWGLPPTIPHQMRLAGYRPFVETVRASLRYSEGLRIDHVMGCFRLFWIPSRAEPKDGMYVQYPYHDMLGILKLEAARTPRAANQSSPFIIGEDLGTVEPYVRETLEKNGIFQFRLQIFEDHPERFPEHSMAMVTTHDLPTLAGLWSGADEKAMLQAIPELKPGVNLPSLKRVQQATGLAADTPVEGVVEQEYRVLGESPAEIVLVTLEDLLAIEERPNMPGTVDQWPNWRLAIPGGIERLEQDDLPWIVTEILANARQ